MRINQLRGWVTLVIRAVAVALLALGLYLCLKRLLFAFENGFNVAFSTWGSDFGESSSFYRGAAMLAVGAVLAVSSRVLARWIVRVPPEGCPNCGQSLGPDQPARCPECGYKLKP